MFTRRTITPTALVALAALAVGSSAGNAAVQASSTATPRCTSGNLEVWLGLGAGGAAAGSSYYPLEFTNVSGHSCHLTGYPGVSAWSSHQLGSPAARVPSGSITPVTLRAGATGHALLQITDVSNLSPASCKPARASQLKVYPPGAFHALLVPFRFSACSLAGPIFLNVAPLQPRVGVPGH
jgi:hypothetical protein